MMKPGEIHVADHTIGGHKVRIYMRLKGNAMVNIVPGDDWSDDCLTDKELAKVGELFCEARDRSAS